MPPKAPHQCLSCRLSALSLPAKPARRQFHASPAAPQRRRPAYPSVKQSALDAQQAHTARVDRLAAVDGPLRPYTARELEVLATRYTPEQMRVIELGEQAVDRRHLVEQGRLRGDAFRPTYIDDFATLRPLVDNPVRLALDDAQTSGKKRDDVKKVRIPGVQYSNEEEDPHLTRLCQQTGMTKEQIRRIRIKNLVSHRVVNQTRMGKIQSLYYLTIAGNQDGMLGIGEGKAAEDEDGRRQAMMNAIRNMRPIARYEERTIYGDVEAKVGGSVVQLSARAPGFGNRTQHLIFELARAAGISDLAARTPRSRNKMNVVKAAFEALTSQRLPEDVARARGRKMVDVRKVYYGGQVH
ncbi:hypothetical protein LTR08_002626 [Meristemomyces frigidus]|nr:hypothetical protein LTR08_002626 [Meristemomyces frigidus]